MMIISRLLFPITTPLRMYPLIRGTLAYDVRNGRREVRIDGGTRKKLGLIVMDRYTLLNVSKLAKGVREEEK